MIASCTDLKIISFSEQQPSMSDIVVRIDQLSKYYRLGSIGAQTLSGDISRRWAKFRGKPDPLAKVGQVRPVGGSQNRDSAEGLWALKDVSFDFKRGEVLGIIGRNGAGKSTLLKILSRVTAPTSGEVRVKGRIASLLEVGTGFHPELTGRENVFLNGAILGMTKAEIRERFDEIVAFSEVEKFIDTPVKRYSSGMYIRLAFAVAAHLEPEILVVDEVLAVGDAAFQRRCLGKMGEIAGQGRTVFLVSHNMASINRLSDRVLWLKDGSVEAFGDPESVVSRYLTSGVHEFAQVDYSEGSAPGSEFVRLMTTRIRNHEGHITSTLDSRLPFVVEVEYKVLKKVRNLRIGITLSAADSTVVLQSKDTDQSDDDLAREPGSYVGRCALPGEFLNTGQYFVSVGSDTPMIQTHFRVDRVLAFHIEQLGGANGHIPDKRQGLIRMRFPWATENLNALGAGREVIPRNQSTWSHA
jgi:lipopolysaccharide transport system ATP-binding protein